MPKTFFIINLGYMDINLVLFILAVYHVSSLGFSVSDVTKGTKTKSAFQVKD